MTPARLRAYCLGKRGAWPDSPWEGDQVAKVGPRIFAFLGGDSVGVKCGASREEADEWLARFPDDELRAAVDLSYGLVVARLPKKDRPGTST